MMDINRRISIYLWLAVGFCLAILLLMPWCEAAEYEQEKKVLEPIYEEDMGIYEKDPDLYTRREVDQPPEGWYQDPKDFPVPDDWPDWVVGNFTDLTEEGLPERYTSLHKWERPNLQASTKWVDVKASRVKNPLELTAPQGQYFTFFKIDPPNATLEQDFKGNAVVYNTDDALQYSIFAYSENDYLGQFVTAKPTKWVKFIKEVEAPGKKLQRLERVVQDGSGKFFWGTIIHQQGTNHATSVVQLGPDGKMVFLKQLFDITPGFATNPDDFYTDIKVDGRAIVVAAALETDFGESTRGQLRRYIKDPQWVITSNCFYPNYAQVVTNRTNRNGYIYSTNENGVDTYHKINEDGSYSAWGNGGTAIPGCNNIISIATIYGSTRELITDYTNQSYIALVWVYDANPAQDNRAYALWCFDGTETATDGDIKWSLSPLKWFERPRGICMSHDDQHIYMVGDHGTGTVERPANGSSNIAKINALTGVSEWVKESESGVSLWSIERCDVSHRGYIASGEYIEDGLHYLHLVKYDNDFNIEWSKNFRPDNVDVAGRDAVETFDRGFIAVGGPSALGDRTKEPYIVKTNQYGETCSQGNPCR